MITQRIIMLASSVLALSVMVSCEDSENKDVETSVKGVTQLKVAPGGEGWGLHRHFVQKGDDCYCEEGKPYNCFDDIVIVAKPIDPKELSGLRTQPLTSSIVWDLVVPYIERDQKLFEKLKTGDYMVQSLPSRDASRVLCGVSKKDGKEIEYTFQFVTK